MSREVFEKIARPAKDISEKKLIEGLIALRKKFKNTLILEIFIIPGINDNEVELSLIKNACIKINPDLIQLNTLDRPGTEKWIKPASIEKLTEIKRYFEPLKIQIIQNHKIIKEGSTEKFADSVETIISSLSRRPSTIEDLSLSLGINNDEVLNILNSLLEKGEIIKEESITRGEFYRLKT